MKTKKLTWLPTIATMTALFAIQPTHGAIQPSKISAFAGDYSGTVSLIQSSSSPAFGTTQGFFNASKKRQNGTLTLTSAVVSSGSTVPIQEQYLIHGKSLTYILTTSGSSAVGTGRARVAGNTIHYSAIVSSGGNTTTISGTIRRSSKKLVVTEQLVSPSFSAFFNYQLHRRGK